MIRWVGVALFVLACFWGFWSYGLFDLDEGLYAVSLMEMQQRGDWVVPTYRGEPFFEKPILFYWTAWIAELCGADGVTALRLPSVLATLATLGVVAAFTKRVAPVAILAVGILFLGVGRMFMPDPLLVLSMTCAAFGLYKSREDGRWFVVVGAALGVSVLAKGPMPAVVLALLAAYAHLCLKWQFGSLGWRLAGAVAFFAVALPWYVLAAVRSPVFVDEFLIQQNLGRLAGGDTAHLGPVWMYVPVVLVGLMPFSLSILAAWRSRKGSLEHFLWAYVLIVFVLFSLAGTKLPHYILPIFPPLAVLISRHLARVERVHWEYPLAPLVLGCAGMLFAAVVGLDALEGVVAGSIGGLFAIGAAPAYWFAARRRPVAAGFAAVATATAALVVIGPSIYYWATHEEAAEAARAAAATRLPVIEYRTGGEGVAGKTSHPSMQWIMGRNTEPIDDAAQLLRRLSQGQAVVITRAGRLEADLAKYDILGRLQTLFLGKEFEVVVIDSQASQDRL